MGLLFLIGGVSPRGSHRDKHKGHFSLGALLCFIEIHPIRITIISCTILVPRVGWPGHLFSIGKAVRLSKGLARWDVHLVMQTGGRSVFSPQTPIRPMITTMMMIMMMIMMTMMMMMIMMMAIAVLITATVITLISARSDPSGV